MKELIRRSCFRAKGGDKKWRETDVDGVKEFQATRHFKAACVGQRRGEGRRNSAEYLIFPMLSCVSGIRSAGTISAREAASPHFRASDSSDCERIIATKNYLTLMQAYGSEIITVINGTRRHKRLATIIRLADLPSSQISLFVLLLVPCQKSKAGPLCYATCT